MKIFFDSDTVTNEPGDFVIPKQVTRSEYRVHCFLVRFCLWGESIKVSTRRDCIYIVSYRCTQQLKFFACTVKTQDKHQKCSVWIVEIGLIKYTFVSIYEYIEWNKRVLCLEQNVRMFFQTVSNSRWANSDTSPQCTLWNALIFRNMLIDHYSQTTRRKGKCCKWTIFKRRVGRVKNTLL